MPLTIYADILVLNNLYIDFFLLWCVKKFLHLHPGKGRLVLGALAGALSALLVLLPVSRLILLLFGALSALAATAAAFAPLKPFLFWKAALAFWVFSFLLAGFLLFLLTYLPTSGLAVLGNAVYFDFSPLFLLCATCAAYLVFSLLQKLFPKSAPARYCRICVENQGRTAVVLCKADTGCSLHEPFSGLPVLVAEAGLLKPVAPLSVLSYLESSSADGKLRLVPFESMGGSGLLPAFRPDRVYLQRSGESLECYVALCPRKLSAGQFNGLYNPDLFPETISFEPNGGIL
ncbi:sigma-E processing peptidase SpoIIGA [Neglectibacter timonensis]|uniref:Sigma-E processing peptidase SpoIIGA n=2 Tax=Neglectibacter timonensis TaxID=1776382 RepID=A0ABT1RYP9_9FIRM|nr:sigma-E processing peptidase SpoIIGA [Neglectibacter timonensis]MCQ4839815.1 sigma-E processing peptidase SpoIIGA [Neglectibacter timonensis]MCQ4843523.1 sigma-E processing peptidase SpoIIGA [Neglectibacter timonensis]